MEYHRRVYNDETPVPSNPTSPARQFSPTSGTFANLVDHKLQGEPHGREKGYWGDIRRDPATGKPHVVLSTESPIRGGSPTNALNDQEIDLHSHRRGEPMNMHTHEVQPGERKWAFSPDDHHNTYVGRNYEEPGFNSLLAVRTPGQPNAWYDKSDSPTRAGFHKMENPHPPGEVVRIDGKPAMRIPSEEPGTP